MTVQYKSRVHAKYLELVCTADYAPEVPIQITEEGFRRAAGADRRALLLDIRGVIGQGGTLSERFDQAVQFSNLQAGMTPRIRVAVLGKIPIVHPQRFGEIVATNRGATIRVFTEEQEALDWLLQGQDPC